MIKLSYMLYVPVRMLQFSQVIENKNSLIECIQLYKIFSAFIENGRPTSDNRPPGSSVVGRRLSVVRVSVVCRR